MQHVTASWNILQQPATSCSMMQHVAASCNSLQNPSYSINHAANMERATWHHGTTCSMRRTTDNLLCTTCNKRTATSASTSTGSLAFAALQGTSHGTDEPREACPAAATLTARCHRRALVGTPRVRPSTREYPVGTAEHSWVPRGIRRDAPLRAGPPGGAEMELQLQLRRQLEQLGAYVRTAPPAPDSTARANRASPLRCRRSAAGAAMRRGA
jgi:hypothetical protein